MRGKLRRTLVLASVLAGVGLSSVPALAQSGDEEARLRKIESEVRALQRRVFPGGDGRFFEPEVETGTPGTEIVPIGPSTSAVTDILGRLDSIEAQLARLTSQVEVNAYDIGLLTSRLEVIEAEREQRLAAERAVEEAAQREAAERQAALEAEPEPPSPERVAAVQAIAKPDSGDPGDDEYVYGFRLWQEGLFPEAQQQLRLFLDNHPDHWRVSYGRNLLGRAYLDDGKPREAAPWFLQNYQSDPDGIRAPDSLLFLAEAMVAIDDTNRACIALAEFGEKFPALATGRLQEQYESDRAKVTCD
ncbi:MAG TPA: hypothetical protein VLA37_04025 [Sphingomonadaceae bacterium]|nr:hypothetical protein [Sphingomonadaceae bacterium]